MTKLFSTLALCCALNAVLLAQQTISVNLANEIRPVTHCASGSLYGVTETLPSDINNLVAPLKPNVFANPAISGTGHQQPIGDALKVSERLVNTTARIQVRLADILPGWPYRWPGKESFLNQCAAIINAKKATGRNNYDGYEIWNEPYGTWDSKNGDYHADLWKPVYDLIRQLDPDERIIGPSFAYYNSSRMNSFLTFCKANNCLPDVICWHQWGSGGFVAALENYRQLEKNLGIDPIPVSINEYSSQTSDPYEGCPGYSVPFIAKFERHMVESACLSWWHTAYPGRLGSLLTPANEKGGGWHLYKWYGDMSGKMVEVNPPDDYSDGLDGFACIDLDLQYASICIGGDYTGAAEVVVNNIPATFGSAVNVLLEYVTWVNKDSPVAGTTEISSAEYKINNQSLTVPVDIASNLYAYRIYITPAETAGPPPIQIKTTDGNTGFHFPASIPLDIEVTDEEGAISRIEFYDNNNDQAFHVEQEAPYTFNWTAASAGLHVIRAVAYDKEGNTSEDSFEVSVQAAYGTAPAAIPGTVEFENYDLGGNGYAYFDDSDGNETDITFRADEDVDIEECTDDGGGFNIGFSTAAEWLEYTVKVTESGLYKITIRAACNGDGRTLLLSGDNGSVISDAIAIPNTGGWQDWTDVVVENIALTKGEQVLRATIGDASYINLNYMRFEPMPADKTEIELKAGWNLIGCTLEGATPIKNALSSVWDELELIKDLDSFYDSTQSDDLNTLSQLKWGYGYFIKVKNSCSLIW